MSYSSKLLDYFENPRCAGELADANAIAEVSNPICGDVMKLWLKVHGGRIVDARFKTQGCSAAIATSSYATEMIIGMDLARARAVTREEIAEALGGLPPSKMHCSVLASDAIRAALKDFA
jgi:nitrogen fixation protein NifU and related proteins